MITIPLATHHEPRSDRFERRIIHLFLPLVMDASARSAWEAAVSLDKTYEQRRQSIKRFFESLTLAEVLALTTEEVVASFKDMADKAGALALACLLRRSYSPGQGPAHGPAYGRFLMHPGQPGPGPAYVSQSSAPQIASNSGSVGPKKANALPNTAAGEASHSTFIPKRILDGRQILVPDGFISINCDSCDRRITMTLFLASLTDDYAAVDVADNRLMEERSLRLLLEKLDTLKKVELVDLSGNRFSAELLPIICAYLAKHPEVTYFVIIGNPMAGVDAAPHFQALAATYEKVFQQLIWIPDAVCYSFWNSPYSINSELLATTR